MNNQTSTKNIVIGFVLGVVATATLGAALKQNNEVGRFQVSAGAHVAYVVDTVTGQVWASGNSSTFKAPKAENRKF